MSNFLSKNDLIVLLLMKKTLLDHGRLAKGLATTSLRTDVRMQLGHSNDKLFLLSFFLFTAKACF